MPTLHVCLLVWIKRWLGFQGPSTGDMLRVPLLSFYTCPLLEGEGQPWVGSRQGGALLSCGGLAPVVASRALSAFQSQ